MKWYVNVILNKCHISTQLFFFSSITILLSPDMFNHHTVLSLTVILQGNGL